MSQAVAKVTAAAHLEACAKWTRVGRRYNEHLQDHPANFADEHDVAACVAMAERAIAAFGRALDHFGAAAKIQGVSHG